MSGWHQHRTSTRLASRAARRAASVRAARAGERTGSEITIRIRHFDGGHRHRRTTSGQLPRERELDIGQPRARDALPKLPVVPIVAAAARSNCGKRRAEVWTGPEGRRIGWLRRPEKRTGDELAPGSREERANSSPAQSRTHVDQSPADGGGRDEGSESARDTRAMTGGKAPVLFLWRGDAEEVQVPQRCAGQSHFLHARQPFTANLGSGPGKAEQ